MSSSPLPTRKSAGFTLVELMVATAILMVILILIFNITQQTGEAWKNSAAKIESFQGARAAFESMTRRISQATLNTYYDYFNAGRDDRTKWKATTGVTDFIPEIYGRYSDLHFVAGKDLVPGAPVALITHSIFFQAPTGFSDDTQFKSLENGLNAVGYFVEYANDDALRPPFLNSDSKYRFRLMQFTQPTQNLAVYDPTITDLYKWFRGPMELSPTEAAGKARPAWQIAENVVALIIHPKRSSQDGAPEVAPGYEYDSREEWTSGSQPISMNQLPPLVEVTMVAVDEPSFVKFGNPSTAPDFGYNTFFKDPAKFDEDLRKFSDVLAAVDGNQLGNKHKFKFQVFNAEVPIRAAKWSE